MVTIYSFLNNALQELKQENKSNYLFLFFLLFLISIPLPFAFNNIALAIFIVTLFYNFKSVHFKFQNALLWPILLYLIMALSWFWTSNKAETLGALSKEIALLILPILFFYFQISTNQKNKIFKFYSYSIAFLAIYFLSRAVIRYLLFQDSRCFVYHGENDDDYGLVPKLLNAIHVSVYAAMAFFYFFTKKVKTTIDIVLAVLLALFILLLSSKNIILVFIVLILIYIFFYSKSSHKMRLRNLILFLSIIILGFSFGTIKERFQQEFRNNSPTSLSNDVSSTLQDGVHNVSIYEAWNNEKFSTNDFFPGTAFRVYQARIFFELLQEENIFFNGFGLNASYAKLKEKELKYNLYAGYGDFNFHNQYIQNFAELGVVGLLLLLIMLVLLLKKAIKSKDFLHFSFAILMISLFLTESFLWRQRGVVFFTTMYCLFMTYTEIKSENKIE